MEYNKPLPIPNEDSKPYWDSCRQHILQLQKCDQCGHIWFPPSPLCPSCLSQDFTWEKLSGEGTVYSYVVVQHAFRPVWKEDIPFIVALVELKERVRLFTNITNCDPAEVAIGKPVKVIFDDVTTDITLPKFELV